MWEGDRGGEIEAGEEDGRYDGPCGMCERCHGEL